MRFRLKVEFQSIAGRALSTVLILVGYIRRTTSRTGLKVTATCFEKTYLAELIDSA